MEEEEEEDDATAATGPVFNLIAILQQAHQENGRLYYYATSAPGKPGHSIMPVTPFVFELFIYNSIYQVDWPTSLKARQVIAHPGGEQGFNEPKQQSELEKFLRGYVRGKPSLLYEAYVPIRDMELEGDWTEVVPDERISIGEGKDFFERLRSLRAMLQAPRENFVASKKCFALIAQCRLYVYLVRNNVFHGSKTLGETYEPHQRRRIELYLFFVRCMNELFFSVCHEIGLSPSK